MPNSRTVYSSDVSRQPLALQKHWLAGPYVQASTIPVNYAVIALQSIYGIGQTRAKAIPVRLPVCAGDSRSKSDHGRAQVETLRAEGREARRRRRDPAARSVHRTSKRLWTSTGWHRGQWSPSRPAAAPCRHRARNAAAHADTTRAAPLSAPRPATHRIGRQVYVAGLHRDGASRRTSSTAFQHVHASFSNTTGHHHRPRQGSTLAWPLAWWCRFHAALQRARCSLRQVVPSAARSRSAEFRLKNPEVSVSGPGPGRGVARACAERRASRSRTSWIVTPIPHIAGCRPRKRRVNRGISSAAGYIGPKCCG